MSNPIDKAIQEKAEESAKKQSYVNPLYDECHTDGFLAGYQSASTDKDREILSLKEEVKALREALEDAKTTIEFMNHDFKSRAGDPAIRRIEKALNGIK